MDFGFEIFGAYAITLTLLVVGIIKVWSQWINSLDKIRELEAESRKDSNDNLNTLKDVSSALKNMTDQINRLETTIHNHVQEERRN